MKNNSEILFEELSEEVLTGTNGGESNSPSPVLTFLYHLWHFGKAAAEYQASLPPNLKK